MQQFQADLQEQGLADHPSIAAMDIMQRRPTVQQVMDMPPFVQALRRKNEERQALAQTIVAQRSVLLPPSRNTAQPEGLSTGEDIRRQRQRSEPLGLARERGGGFRNAESPSPSLERRIVHSQGTADRANERECEKVGQMVSSTPGHALLDAGCNAH